MTLSQKVVIQFLIIAVILPLGFFFYGWLNWEPQKYSPKLKTYHHPSLQFSTQYDPNYFKIKSTISAGATIHFLKDSSQVTFFFPTHPIKKEKLKSRILTKENWNLISHKLPKKVEWIVEQNYITTTTSKNSKIIGEMIMGQWKEKYFSVVSIYPKNKDIFLQKQADLLYHLNLP